MIGWLTSREVRVAAGLGAAAAAAALVALIVLGLDPGGAVRAVAGGAFVLLAPGLAATWALFGTREVRPLERLVIGIGLSLALTIIAGLASFTVGIPMTLVSWLATLGLVVALGSAAAWQRGRAGAVRDGALGDDRQADAPVPGVRSSRRSPDWRRVAYLGQLPLAAILVVAAVAIARQDAVQQPTPAFTSLAIAPVGDGRVTLEVANEEQTTATFRLVLNVDDAVAAEWPEITLAAGERWSGSAEIAATAERVAADLYRADAPDAVYRTVDWAAGGNG